MKVGDVTDAMEERSQERVRIVEAKGRERARQRDKRERTKVEKRMRE